MNCSGIVESLQVDRASHDAKSIDMGVLRHRMTITYEPEAEEKTTETVVQKIFDELPVP